MKKVISISFRNFLKIGKNTYRILFPVYTHKIDLRVSLIPRISSLSDPRLFPRPAELFPQPSDEGKPSASVHTLRAEGWSGMAGYGGGRGLHSWPEEVSSPEQSREELSVGRQGG